MAISQQRRGRSIAMTPAELDEFLAQAHTCRVATLTPDGPHVVPLWFAWTGGALWLSSLVRSQRWADLIRDPRVAVTRAPHDRTKRTYGLSRHVPLNSPLNY